AVKLAKSGNLAKLQLYTLWSNLVVAKSQIDAATADLERNQVKSHIERVVDREPVALGRPVMQGGEVDTDIALVLIIARGAVSERDLGYVKVGDRASVTLVNGQTVEGVVRYISRDASVPTRTFRVDVAIPNPEGTIPAGMTAEITLSAEPTDAVLLPRSDR